MAIKVFGTAGDRFGSRAPGKTGVSSGERRGDWKATREAKAFGGN